jgi:hypothetical protein
VKTHWQRIVIGVGLALVLALVVIGKRRAKQSGKPDVPPSVATIYQVDAWLDSCLTGCRRTASRRLGHLSPEKRERYCAVNCECGMEKMTEPGPSPRTVRAPSARWLALSEDDQAKAGTECQQRTKAEVGE